ncbi:ATP dependent DNA ligase [Hirsutella rhossiliensis]|uniref:ATP dependent DNA ligase domain-containing protein n=1 Tax=Hirsutella rhossiliensis TaxID=111463 RepID=A0A9P8N001_9HYPO|nr:ATP dependent DNA ligase domain-containing protein [Hirsutella rhossiliensis]KAH0965173.1 ATP dependent DNA ligase domain-containing protein [Hirsutella rhossiliensis]
MPLHFSLICDLLDECQRLRLARRPNKQAVFAWVAELARYKQPGLGLDLADCVERILTTTPNPRYAQDGKITVEEIDDVLHALASKIRWSSPAVRSRTARTQCHPDVLAGIYRRLGAKEAKWFTRLILKDFQPLILECNLVYGCCHPLLPLILKIQDDFAAAIKVIQDVRGTMLPNSTRAYRTNRAALLSLKPQLGIKVGRQNWLKARSIKHCVNMGHGYMSVEKKIDGEYCQIHVDTSGQSQSIQIFSKSGKDSTEDRQGLRGVITKSLQLGLPSSKIRKKCILEGELVVYNDLEQKILPFHTIRNHVARRGHFLNTEDDSPPKPWERLMIVYFDILLLDDRSLLDVRHSERFKLLEQVVHPRKGRAELVSRHVIDIRLAFAVSELRKVFANVIMDRGEGLVLKPDEPYFNFHHNDEPFGGRCIKLKKEYIGNFGDVGDFAVVGAGFVASKAKTYAISNLQWTHFYIGCLDNKEQVQRWNATPEFTVVSVVELNEGQLETLLKFGNSLTVPLAENNATRLKIPKGIETGPPLAFAFCNPLVFDLRCFSFDKPGNTGFWTLRFPVVSKIHFDRDFSETVSFEELQLMAEDATTVPELEDSQENLAWIARLERSDPRGLPVDAVQSGPRRPLVDVDGNASQHPAMTCDSNAAVYSPPECRLRDDNQCALDELLVGIDTPAQKKGTVSENEEACEGTSVKETAHALENKQPPPSSCPAVVLGCATNATAAVSSLLLAESTESAQLLKAHGVLDAATSVDQWIELARAGSTPGASSKKDRAKMLLVDSVKDPVEAKNLLARVEEARSGLSRRQRDLITVYDWRVLRHITVLEDKSITNKYYDGFRDPWRRWYCGII